MENILKITNGKVIYHVVQIGDDEYKLLDNENEELSRMDSSNNYGLVEIWNWYHIDKFMKAHDMWICDEEN